MSEKTTQHWITCQIDGETIVFWAFTRTLSGSEVTEAPTPIRLTIGFVKALIGIGVRVTCKDPHASGERIRATTPMKLPHGVVQDVLELCCIQLGWDPKKTYYIRYVEEISVVSTI